MNIGMVVKNGRKRAGITQQELAKKLDINRSTVAAWEINKQVPSGDILIKIAKILDIRDELFSLDENSDPPVTHKIDNKITELERRLESMAGRESELERIVKVLAEKANIDITINGNNNTVVGKKK